MEILRNMLKEINKKIDVVNRREGSFEKKLDNVDKRLGGLIRQVNRVSRSMLIELPSRCVPWNHLSRKKKWDFSQTERSIDGVEKRLI